MSGYTPFAISKFETGQFQYLQPWISPDDAFGPLINSYVFRGQVNKRQGRELFGTTGRLRYTNNENIALGNTGMAMSGILANFPLEKAGFYIKAEETGPVFETFTDNASNGILVGNLGGSGTIDYTTGIWGIETISGGGFLLDTPIIAHYTFSTNTTNAQPIVLITEFVNEISDLQFAVVNDTKRSAIFNSSTELFDPISTFSQIIWAGNGVSTSFTFTTIGWKKIAPYSVTITDGTSTITDIPGVYPAGSFTTAGNFAAGSTIDYESGGIVINFTIPPTTSTLIVMTGALQGDYYTGTRANLFNSINWKPSDLQPGLLYMTNNVDPVTTFDGTNLSRKAYGITLANVLGFVNDIKTTLDVKVYQNTLLFIRPTLVGAFSPEGQTIRWSSVANPTAFNADVAGSIGKGGFKTVATSDWIQSASYLRDAMVIDCDNSTFLFRNTGSTADPFRLDKINSTKSTNTPYGSIEYDDRVTSMGSKGLCYCDGVNKERYDLEVIDLYNDIDFDNFSICQGRRFDQLQQSWMIYPSVAREGNINCDKVIVYNWIENVWSTYIINLTCIGSARTFEDDTWSDFGSQTWEQVYPSNATWDTNFSQALVPWVLGGDADGLVYYLDRTDFDYDIHTNTDVGDKFPFLKNIGSQIVSKRWNPFVQQGQKGSFGWIDFYYLVNPQIELVLNFYVNSSDVPSLTRTMVLDGFISKDAPVSNEQYTWQRVFVNVVGEFLRLEILSSQEPSKQGSFTIAGMILWARPAGRLVPGTFL